MSHSQHHPPATQADHTSPQQADDHPTAAPAGGREDHGGHGGHVAVFRRLFWWNLLLAVPTVAASGMFASILGYPLPDVAGLSWVSPVLGTVIYLWGGRPFLTGAVDEIGSRKPGMMLLVALAITVAFASSWASTLGLVPHGLDFWWELALLVVIMLLGHWVEMRSLAQTSSALDSLAALLPDEAQRVQDGQIVPVAPADLQVGDVVVVRPGGRIPADGRVTDGSAAVDESMITGESPTVTRGVGDPVVAGTVATDSGIRVQVTATGEDTTLAGIGKLVADAQASGSRAQRLADTAAGWLFWFALGAGILTAIVWSTIGAPEDAVIRTITVLVIACPHALGLAIPLVISIGTERAARAGVLIKDRVQMEAMRTVDTVLFDKTGTLTVGRPTLTDIRTADHPTADPGQIFDADRVLALAAAAETDSEHPLAQAIVRAAADRGLTNPTAADFTSSPAIGVQATVEGRAVAVGGPGLLAQAGAAELPVADQWRKQGSIILHVLADGVVIGALALADEIRPESRAAVDQLRDRGAQVVMITGDAEAVAGTVAAQLGIDRYFAGVRPEDKSATVADLQAEGRRVAMVGDGVNDAPALAQADVGIAIGAGTDVAIASAGIVLASADPRSVVSVIDLSAATYRKSVQNLAWGASYNLISVPLAAGVLAPIGFVMPMSIGALLMSASTIVVALNAQLLRRLDLRPGPTGPDHHRPDPGASAASTHRIEVEA
ncbi:MULTISPECIES: heavy metal translocating P-type ATPase [Geodermatophilaceae]|jgi:Cu2+-exporting ATPase|uniref:heavy metal translocating P-type ATPase n=1 Tax=Geodermatophilaceae TaxID=85030 RepID=UPI0009EA8C8B|nr:MULTISPECIES: heavy metal translocating P-type ATPase [Geodermatophilaceae]